MASVDGDGQGPVAAAVNGGHMDEIVTCTAALLARRKRRALLLLHVIEVGHQRPLETSDELLVVRAEAVLAAAETHVGERRVKVETEVCQARAASTAIIAAALRHDAASIVVGAHRFLGQHECDLGFTATHVLRHSPIPVTVCYDPIR